MAYDGTIRINTEIDAQGFNKGVNSLESTFKGYAKNQKEATAEIQKDVINAAGKIAIALTAAVTAAAGAAIKAGIDFETAFAGVRKTVDATEKQFEALEAEIRAMALRIPASANEIANVAEAAGQLGIATGDILDFTEVMVNLGNATNLSATDAATALARFANITGNMNFDRVGSAIVALGNNLATTESEIVNMAQSMSGTATTIGLTADQILAYAAAISSVGIESEAGATAFSRVISDMSLAVSRGGESLEQFASVAGMSAEEFARAFQEDANSAIIAFIEGLGKISDEGGDVVGTLDEMGMADIRVSRLLQAAANSTDTFTDALRIASEAYAENTALSKEAEERYKTTQSQIQLLKNNVTELALVFADTLLPTVNKVVAELTKFIGWLQDNPEVITAFAIAVGALTLAFIAFNIGQLATTIAATGMATALWAALAPILLIIALIAALAVAFVFIAKVANKPAVAVEELGDAVMENGEKISEGTAAAVQSFLDLQDEASQALKELQWTGTAVTEDMASNIVAKFNEMADLSIEAIERQRDESLAALQDMFAQSSTITAERAAELLSLTQSGFDDRITKVEEYNAERIAILESAAREERALTAGENTRLLEIEEELQRLTIRAMSQSEAEQLAILTHLKNNAGALATEQAAEIAQKAIEQRDATVAAAEQEYYDRLAAAELLRAQGTEEAIAAADEIVAEAQRQYDETVALAEANHAAIIAEAQEQAGENVGLVDWETGEIMSKWQAFWFDYANREVDRSKQNQEIWKQFVETIKNAWESAKTWVSDSANEIAEKVGSFVSNIIKSVNDGFAKVVDAGKNLVTGIWEGIRSSADWLLSRVREWCGSILSGIKSFFGIKSPSKLLAEEVGKWLPPGITAGIEITADAEMRKYKDFVNEFARVGQAEITAGYQEIEQRYMVSGTAAAQPSTTTKTVTTYVEINSGVPLSESQLTDEMMAAQRREEWAL